MVNRLSWIMDNHADAKVAFKAARERIKKSGIRHWPPETDDEELVSLYPAVWGRHCAVFVPQLPAPAAMVAVIATGPLLIPRKLLKPRTQ
jgi:hypothetical protein